jgi:hypothetical protein
MPEHYYVGLRIQSSQPISNTRIKPVSTRPDNAFHEPIAGHRPQPAPATVVDYDIISSNSKTQIRGKVASTVAQVGQMWVTTHRTERGQRGQVIQVLDAVHVARVYNKIDTLKDMEDLIWEALHAIGQMGIGEHADDDSVPILLAVRHQPTPPAPNRLPGPATDPDSAE